MTSPGAKENVEHYTPEQEAALQQMIDAFGIVHGKVCADIEAYAGKWTKAEVRPCKRLLRKSESRCKI
jgi:hypothetical protein